MVRKRIGDGVEKGGRLTFVAEVLHAFTAQVLRLKVGAKVLLRGELLFGHQLALLGDTLFFLLLQAIVQRTCEGEKQSNEERSREKKKTKKKKNTP